MLFFKILEVGYVIRNFFVGVRESFVLLIWLVRVLVFFWMLLYCFYMLLYCFYRLKRYRDKFMCNKEMCFNEFGNVIVNRGMIFIFEILFR